MSADLVLWYILMAGLLWSVFCRLVRTSKRTLLVVRLSIFQLGLAGLMGIAAPLYGWRPDLVVFAITFACLCMQVVAARHWRGGVPPQFQNSVQPTEVHP